MGYEVVINAPAWQQAENFKSPLMRQLDCIYFSLIPKVQVMSCLLRFENIFVFSICIFLKKEKANDSDIYVGKNNYILFKEIPPDFDKRDEKGMSFHLLFNQLLLLCFKKYGWLR